METNKTKRRGAGRPKDDTEDRRERLIEAAGPIFSAQGYGATRIPDLAKAAGVTPAMVHYYFGGKDGLIKAVFDSAFMPLLDRLEEPSTLEEWVQTFHEHLIKHRWMPHLIIREVVMDGGFLRGYFAERYAQRIMAKWLAIFTGEKTAGRMRKDADDMRHTVLMMGMIVYPFIVAPLSDMLTESPFGDEQIRAFREDAVRLFYSGVGVA